MGQSAPWARLFCELPCLLLTQTGVLWWPQVAPHRAAPLQCRSLKDLALSSGGSLASSGLRDPHCAKPRDYDGVTSGAQSYYGAAVAQDPDEAPTSLDGAEPVVWSLPARAVAKARRPPARRWVHIVGGLLVATAPALMVVSLFWGDRSMDVPWGDPVRYGLFRNGLPVIWQCGEGHEHRSIPFWMAALVLLGAALGVWRLLARIFTRPLPPSA